MDETFRQELSAIAQQARELLRWEEEIGGGGVPPIAAEPPQPEGPAASGGTAAPPEPAGSAIAPGAEPARPQASLFGEPKRAPGRRGLGTRPRVGSGRAGEPEPTPQIEGLPPEERRERLAVLQEQARACTQCGLHRGRTNSVFARGSPDAELVFIGEGPGFHEDQQGLPFVGRAGKLLDKMIAAMGYRPDEVYICNVVKCRPPDNRTPLPDEAAACLPYLEGQLEAIGPKVMVALGRTAAEHLECIEREARGWRGRWRYWRGVPVMPTYHPAFLLRSPQFKRPVWEDLQQVMAKLGKEPPPKRST